MRQLVMAGLGLIVMASMASAQPVPNPTRLHFTASLDHQAVTTYEVGWFLAGATDAVSTVDLGKPAPDTVTGCASPAPCIEAAVNVMPLPFAEYTAKVRARAGTLASDWSVASNPFVRVPGAPGGPVVKK